MDSSIMSVDDHTDTDDNGDGEGVWSPDIEKCFREALILYPPCGRRKHILQEEGGGGKMYGRNELIARYIKMQTGKIRSRKQVSSHIQVLARRRAKAESGHGGHDGTPDMLAGSSTSSSPPNHHQLDQINNLSLNDTRYQRQHQQQQQQIQQLPSNIIRDFWTDRPIVTTKIRLVEFSAFIEHLQLAQQHLAALAAHPVRSATTTAATNGLGPNMNNNHHQTSTDLMTHGQSIQQRLLVPPYEAYPGRNPILANNHHPTSQLASSPHNHHHHHLAPTYQFNQTLQVNGTSTTSPSINNNHNNPYPSLPSSNTQLQQPLNNNQHHHQQMNQRNTETNNSLWSACSSPMISSYQQQQQQQQQGAPTSSAFTRHSYVKIDYRMPLFRQFNKLECIDIGQIQDKFPEIGGPEGLYQRGPADAFYLIKFWADINNDFEYNIEDQNAYFGFSCHFETIEQLKNITCSTKACSYGLQVVEKVETIYGAFNSTNGRYSYNIDRSPMCEFMIQFIKKLRQLPRVSQMNSVLENFSVLQVITSESSSEILLCLAFVFEIASADQNMGSLHHVYKLTKD